MTAAERAVSTQTARVGAPPSRLAAEMSLANAGPAAKVILVALLAFLHGTCEREAPRESDKEDGKNCSSAMRRAIDHGFAISDEENAARGLYGRS
jgi:hypothetical protein